MNDRTLEKLPERLEQTVDAYTEALRAFNAEETPRYRGIAQNNRARAIKLLRELEAEHGPEDTPG